MASSRAPKTPAAHFWVDRRVASTEEAAAESCLASAAAAAPRTFSAQNILPEEEGLYAIPLLIVPFRSQLCLCGKNLSEKHLESLRILVAGKDLSELQVCPRRRLKLISQSGLDRSDHYQTVAKVTPPSVTDHNLDFE